MRWNAIASIPSFAYANFLDMVSYYSAEKGKQFKELDNGEELAEQGELNLAGSPPMMDLPQAISANWLQEEILREFCRRKLQAMDDRQLMVLYETTKV